MFALLIISGLSPAIAQPAQPNEKLVKLRLIAEHGSVKPGDEIWIGIEQSIADHWHVYWKNPGDSGTETRAQWSLPNGFEISEIQWPTPQKIPYGPLMNYGYEGNLVLLQKLKIPQTIPEGEVKLSADIELLVCKEECIPEYGTYTLSLNGPESQNEDNSEYLKRAAAKLPTPITTPTTFSEANGNFVLNIALDQETLSAIQTNTAAFFPADWGIIQNPAPLNAAVKDSALTLTQARGERSLDSINTLSGVISFETTSGQAQSIAITATTETTTASQPETPNPTSAHNNAQTKTQSITILKAIFFALLGGIILNLMPCVFPVLSIKALSLVKTADQHPALARKHGVAYTLGVILSFITIAAALLALKQAGAQIGWGFQLQNASVITALSFMLFIIGLNLMGYFKISSAGLSNIGGKLTQGGSISSSFFTGVLATIVASPCTAPFMAGAIGFALTQSPIVNLIIFASLGLGLALPYLLLSFIPALQRLLPRPGAWMETFQQFLAFPMFLSAIWLVWVLSQQTGSSGVLHVLLGMAAIVFGIWILKRRGQGKVKRFITLALALIAFGSAGALAILEQNQSAAIHGNYEEMDMGESFSQNKLETLLEGDNAILVEMTAAWCITCKVNHAVGINIEQTRTALKDHNVSFLIGDWTNQDPEITQYLNTFGRNGVPIYVYYGVRKSGERPEAIILPQILKPDTINTLITQDHNR